MDDYLMLSGVQAGANLISGMTNYALSNAAADHAASRNYHYNELAARNADERTRALYTDFMSPAARIRQLKQAGLSPSLYADGAGAGSQGVTAGAQGAGAGGVGAVPASMQPVDVIGAKLAEAQINKLNAEATNIQKDTDLKILQEELNQMQNNLYKTEFTLLNAGYQMPNGEIKSYYDLAGESKNFESFIKQCRDAAIQAGDQAIVQSLASEQGLKTMRSIYLANEKFDRDLSVLSSENMSAKFQKSIAEKLNDSNFAELNKEQAIAQLNAAISTAELTEQQKGSWNRLLKRLESKSETTHDIIVVLAMILNNAMENYNSKVLPSTIHKE